MYASFQDACERRRMPEPAQQVVLWSTRLFLMSSHGPLLHIIYGQRPEGHHATVPIRAAALGGQRNGRAAPALLCKQCGLLFRGTKRTHTRTPHTHTNTRAHTRPHTQTYTHRMVASPLACFAAMVLQVRCYTTTKNY